MLARVHPVVDEFWSNSGDRAGRYAGHTCVRRFRRQRHVRRADLGKARADRRPI
jgi:hypothetical protein